MSTFQTIKTQLQKLLDEANAKTTKTDADITTAVSTLIEGYGVGDSGGGSTKTYADQLYEFYGINKEEYPYLLVQDFGTQLDSGKKMVFVYFVKTITKEADTRIWMYDCLRGFDMNYTPQNWSEDITEFVGQVIERITSANAYVDKTFFDDNSTTLNYGYTMYVNFDIELNNIVVHRLDETPLDGLKDGYDILFHDENNEELAFYSIKQGYGIDAHLYGSNRWADDTGTEVTFPYVPSADLMLYAMITKTYADQLYEHFGINKEEYPYLFLTYSTYSYHGWSRIFFAKTVAKATSTGTAISFGSESLYGTTANKQGAWDEDITTYVSNVQNAIQAVANNTSYNTWGISPDQHYVYTNFDILALGFTEEQVSTLGIYRLDE